MDDLTPEAATAERVRRRQEEPTPENASERPIVVHKSSGDGPKTLRQATEDLAFSRGLQRREKLLASGYTELELQQLGADKIEAARRGDPLGEPPVEVKIADPFGEEGKAQGARRRLGLPTGHTQCERRTFEVALAPGKVSPFTQPMTRPSTEQMVGYLQSRVGG